MAHVRGPKEAMGSTKSVPMVRYWSGAAAPATLLSVLKHMQSTAVTPTASSRRKGPQIPFCVSTTSFHSVSTTSRQQLVISS